MPQSQALGFNLLTSPSGAVLANPASQVGRSLFVNPASGSNASGGVKWSTAFATIAAALAVAMPGDVIYLGTGEYDENIVVTTDYLTIIGAAAGYGRPDWVASAGTPLTVQAQGFVASNIRFSSADSDVVVQNGNGFTYSGCVFDGDGQSSSEALLRLVGLADDDSYTASEGVVSGCLFRGCTSGIGIAMQYAANPSGVGTTDNQIVGNRFVGNGVDLKSLTNTSGGGAGIFLNYLIAGNWFQTVGAAYVYADMNQGAAGDLAANSALISGNWFADAVMIAAQFAIDGQPNILFTGNYDATSLVDGSAFNS